MYIMADTLTRPGENKMTKIFLALTVAFFALAMNAIDIDAAPGDHAGNVHANAQMIGN
jgi:hypothetical protein